MHVGKFRWAVVVVGLAIGVWLLWQRAPTVAAGDLASSTEDRSVFYRLLSRYEHNGEAVDFDIVVGCAVRVTRYGDGSSSYDAFLDPVIYAKGTSDGGAVWQIVPSACEGETTENGKVPRDLLPGAVWFDSAKDFSFGTAYVTEDAFENPKSQLKFLGASILKATRAEWEAFQPAAKKNLVNPREFGSSLYNPTREEIAANLWNKEALSAWLPTSKCYLVEKFDISDQAVIAAIRRKWPSSRPRFWTLSDDELTELTQRVFPRQGVEVRGVPSSDYFHLGAYQAQGFPTRARGGMLHSDGGWGSQLPHEIYPVKMGDGIPWLTSSIANADPIYAEVELDGGRARGFAYCYSTLRWPGGIRDAHLPDYHRRNFATKVDGVPISGEMEANPHYVDGPRFFFENDSTYYLRTQFGF